MDDAFVERYAEIRNRKGACDGDNKDDDSEAEYWVSDDEAFHIGYLELDDPDLDSQFQCWPPSIEVVQYHDCEEYDWLNEFNTFVSSFAWNDSISELSIKDKDKILQAIEENGYEARHEPALMDLCTPRLNGLGHWGTHPLDQVHQERIRKHNQETDNGRRSSPY
jgi:hypothetical protein